ncbi:MULTISPECIES: GNAT family N-acetyltransferase [unclassified Isoptericola]|uniref:GNAT family N-acetyltransferase n=1 Tax=unclassified Isoptericola TaxID=2623355 RepID=UPI003653C072
MSPHHGPDVTTPEPHARPALAVDRYDPADRAALYDVCLRTGDSGEDATDMYEDGELLGHVYLGAYLELEPGLARVLRRADGTAVGYCVATASTVDFERRCEESWWPPLRARLAVPAPDDESPDARLLHAIHAPSRSAAPWLEQYPAHLHVDLLPEAQGGGAGRRVLEAVLDAVAAAGAPGIHLGVGGRNVRAIGFYEHLGFRTLEEQPWGRTMGMSLAGR